MNCESLSPDERLRQWKNVYSGLHLENIVFVRNGLLWSRIITTCVNCYSSKIPVQFYVSKKPTKGLVFCKPRQTSCICTTSL